MRRLALLAAALLVAPGARAQFDDPLNWDNLGQTSAQAVPDAQVRSTALATSSGISRGSNPGYTLTSVQDGPCAALARSRDRAAREAIRINQMLNGPGGVDNRLRAALQQAQGQANSDLAGLEQALAQCMAATNGGVANPGVTNGGVTNGGVTNGGVTNGGTVIPGVGVATPAGQPTFDNPNGVVNGGGLTTLGQDGGGQVVTTGAPSGSTGAVQPGGNAAGANGPTRPTETTFLHPDRLVAALQHQSYIIGAQAYRLLPEQANTAPMGVQTIRDMAFIIDSLLDVQDATLRARLLSDATFVIARVQGQNEMRDALLALGQVGHTQATATTPAIAGPLGRLQAVTSNQGVPVEQLLSALRQQMPLAVQMDDQTYRRFLSAVLDAALAAGPQANAQLQAGVHSIVLLFNAMGHRQLRGDRDSTRERLGAAWQAHVAAMNALLQAAASAGQGVPQGIATGIVGTSAPANGGLLGNPTGAGSTTGGSTTVTGGQTAGGSTSGAPNNGGINVAGGTSSAVTGNGTSGAGTNGVVTTTTGGGNGFLGQGDGSQPGVTTVDVTAGGNGTGVGPTNLFPTGVPNAANLAGFASRLDQHRREMRRRMNVVVGLVKGDRWTESNDFYEATVQWWAWWDEGDAAEQLVQELKAQYFNRDPSAHAATNLVAWIDDLAAIERDLIRANVVLPTSGNQPGAALGAQLLGARHDAFTVLSAAYKFEKGELDSLDEVHAPADALRQMFINGGTGTPTFRFSNRGAVPGAKEYMGQGLEDDMQDDCQFDNGDLTNLIDASTGLFVAGPETAAQAVSQMNSVKQRWDACDNTSNWFDGGSPLFNLAKLELADLPAEAGSTRAYHLMLLQEQRR